MTISDAEQARRATRYELTKRAGILFTAAVVTVSLGMLLWMATQSRERGKENQTLLHTINDCTQPTGECYKRGQRATADAVSNINQVIILAAACSADLPRGLTVTDRQTRIQTCVINALATSNKKP